VWSVTTQAVGSTSIELTDEAGNTFLFECLCPIESDGRRFFLAELSQDQTLHFLVEESSGEIAVVKDPSVLVQLHAHLRVLRDALAGERITVRDDLLGELTFGVFHTIQVGQDEVHLAANLQNPGLVIALQREGQKLIECSEAVRLKVVQHMSESVSKLTTELTPHLGLITGLFREEITYEDPHGVTSLQILGPMVFEGQHLILAKSAAKTDEIVPLQLSRSDGTLQPLSTEQVQRLLKRLKK